MPAKLTPQPYPNFIKYMGSKKKIMDFVIEGIASVHEDGVICDLFAGSASLAGAIGQQVAVVSNDIQAYSSVLARVYNSAFFKSGFPSARNILDRAGALVEKHMLLEMSSVNYSTISTLREFNQLEEMQKSLLGQEFDYEWHLFAKNYSGTWWSYEQCLWIDAIREVAEEHAEETCYDVILAALMHAMAYASQGTGHFAQYRDAKTESSMRDIMIYRRRSLIDYFERKYTETMQWLPTVRPNLPHRSLSLNFTDCLKSVQSSTVYADPPYCFVHYSRFYHALETLVRYDFPELQVKSGQVVKGRYRDDRHQSPFSIRSQALDAFRNLFEGVKKNDSRLVLSYSNTGMVGLDDLESLASSVFPGREIELLLTDHQHMTLGRLGDRHRDVQECLLLVK